MPPHEPGACESRGRARLKPTRSGSSDRALLPTPSGRWARADRIARGVPVRPAGSGGAMRHSAVLGGTGRGLTAGGGEAARRSRALALPKQERRRDRASEEERAAHHELRGAERFRIVDAPTLEGRRHGLARAVAIERQERNAG